MTDSRLVPFVFAAIAVGAAFSLGLDHSFSIHYDAKKALMACERDLPRNQHCVITAVPATTEGEGDE